jgi:hypothetical protein
MNKLRDRLPLPARRMLTEQEAAAYCGAPSVSKWRGECPVAGVVLYPGNAGTRFDVAKLDRWLDEMTEGGASSKPTINAMIASLGDGDGQD